MESLPCEFKNLGFQLYAERLGEDELKKRLEEELKPLPPHSTWTSVQLSLKTIKMKSLFAMVSLASGLTRAAHPVGVGAVGVARITGKPQFPEHEFFRAGAQFPVRLRHGNAGSHDDAGSDIRSCAIKFTDDDSDGPLDILMITGEVSVFWNVPTFEDTIRSKLGNPSDDFVHKNPYYYYNLIEGVRRSPHSFTQLVYYSQIPMLFKAMNGMSYYCKYRIIPEDIDLNMVRESGRLEEKDQRTVWLRKRYESEKRPDDYLRREYAERVSKSPVHYRLQIQLRECLAVDPDSVLHSGLPWDATEFPWFDLADVTITTPIPPDVIERTHFTIANQPNGLELLHSFSPLDYNSIGHLRAKVYPFLQRLRKWKTSSVSSADRNTTYSVEVETGSQESAGTNASITIRLTGKKGRSDYLSLDKWFYNDFKPGQVDTYNLQGFDVGEIYFVEFHSNQGGSFWQNPEWFVNKVTVTSGDGNKYNFPCFRWVIEEMILFRGEATLPFYKLPPTVKDKRTLELRRRKEVYQWDSVSPDMPGNIKAATHSDLPRDVQFTDEKSRSYHTSRKAALLNLGIGKFLTMFEDWDSFDDFKILYRNWILGECPVLADKWMDDRWYAYQFLNSANPTTLSRCTSLPDNFPVTNEHVGKFLERGMNLQQEIEAGNIYIVDYQLLEGARCYGGPILEDMGYNVPAHLKHESADVRYCCNPLALFYVNKRGHLMPLAIQIFQCPCTSNPIWTPDEPNEHDWMLAKLWLRTADANNHQLNVHLLRTHLTTEPFALSTWRNLSSCHPVFRLLQPHIYGVLAIDTIGRKELIGQGGIVDKSLSLGGGGHVEFMEKCFRSLNLQDYIFPKELKKRGVDDPDKLPEFYYRDDGLKLWSAIERFIREIIRIYYENDIDVKRDDEIQDWIMDVHENGWPVNEGHEDHGVPTSIDSLEQLVEILTLLVFTFSCQHAAVNFSQKDYYGFTPNAPAIMRQLPPTEKGKTTMETILKTLPDKSQATKAIATVYILTKFSEDERFLGDYTETTWTDVKALDAIEKFQKELEKITEAIKERNEKLEVPYLYLLPERIPNGTAI